MCGIVGGISQDNIVPFLIEGLKQLEYRGYDSAGLVVNVEKDFKRFRAAGKVSNLEGKINDLKDELVSHIGIAHTRWATHGIPSENNAHPHICNQSIAVVQNGIIENFQSLRDEQLKQGYIFTSDTDTEVIAHCIYECRKTSSTLLEATQKSIKKFQGSFAIAVTSINNPNEIVIAKKSAPMVIGYSNLGLFFASDQLALIDLTSKFSYMEDGDIAVIKNNEINFFDINGKVTKREIITSKLQRGQITKGKFPHFMLKEIYEQPQAIRDTLESKISHNEVYIESFGPNAPEIFSTIEHVKIIACGTSFNAGLVAMYWLEDIAEVSCSVEVASEYRYRKSVTQKNTLFVTISQSGETADTLEALKSINNRQPESVTLCICNTPESSLTRESKLVFLMNVGPEIGVASTKAFTGQLVSLSLLAIAIGKSKKTISKNREQLIVNGLNKLPGLIEEVLNIEPVIQEISKEFLHKDNALFLGRGTKHAIAMEGALKLKEISYIHAEAFAAGELKHGPIALIDKDTPVIVVAPKNDLLEKLKSNMQEVSSRGSVMYVFKDELADIKDTPNMKLISVTKGLGRITGPIIFSIPLQLLSYHVALIRGCDVDQPRNLAKSVTVE